MILRIQWTPADNSTGNVFIEHASQMRKVGTATATNPSETRVVAAGGNQNLRNTDFTITGTDFVIGCYFSTLIVRRGNDASDTYPDNMKVYSVQLVYEKDTNGSRTATTK